MSARTACVDIGSTYTKAALVDPATGQLLATAQAPTTLDDVVTGVLAATAAFPDAPVVACSSAGGGLRLAVVGYEELISAEAGHRAALSAGARVVHVAAGVLDDAALARLRAAEPDVVLLVGGTDGGEASVLRANAAVLAGADWSVPVVLAGNAAVRDEVAAVLRDGGLPVHEADNVLPDIGLLAPESARAAIRAVFLEHVIGGDRLSTDPRLRSWVRAVTPDAVLEGVTVLARVLAAGRDLGRRPRRRRGDHRRLLRARSRRRAGHPRPRGGGRAGPPPDRRGRPGRLVERRRAADGRGRRGVAGARATTRWPSARRRPRSRCAATCGPRRPTGRAGPARAPPVWWCSPAGCSGTRSPAPSTRVVARMAADRGGAGGVLAGTEVVVDRSYVLAATGLLAADHPAAAAELARGLVPSAVTSPAG